MKILIDLYHIPQFNFFKNTILSLGIDQVDLACINRGKLFPIIKNECPGYNIYVIGDYKYNKGPLSMLFRIIIPRFFRLIRLIRKNKYDFVLTAHYQANLAAWFNHVPNIAFIDDPRKIAFGIDKFSTNELYVPCFKDSIAGTKVFNALKEWSYLSPACFKPNIEILDKYGLKSKEYIFVREVDTKTSNYLGQEKNLILSFANLLRFSEKIVLSLENKQNRSEYPSDWIILEEPVKDIHSIMYFSRLILSSGDSVAREGSLLGIQSLYCGFRDMPANQVLINKGILKKIEPSAVPSYIKNILGTRTDSINQELFRNGLNNEWEDINNLIWSKIQYYVKTK